MVSVVEIITEGEIDDLMVGNMQSRQTWNGITARFAGNAWMVEEMTPQARTNYPNVRVNQPLPRALRGNFINLARAAVGYPPVTFSSAGEVRGPINNNPIGGPNQGTVRPGGYQGEPSLVADPNDRPGATPQNNRVPISQITDVYDSRVLTTDDLTTEQKRTLRQTGRIQVGDLTYTQADIDEFDRRVARHMSTLSQENSIKKMTDPGQARQNLRVLSTRMAGRVILRTVIPVAFSPTANISAALALRDMLTRLNQKMIPGMDGYDESYTVADYNKDVTKAMGLWYISTLLPIYVTILRAGGRAITAPFRALITKSIDRFNGEPRMARRGNPIKRWTSYQVRRFVDFLKTEITSFFVVNALMRNQTVQDYVLEALSNEYAYALTEAGFEHGEQVYNMVRRNWPEISINLFGAEVGSDGVESFDDFANWVKTDLGLDIDRGLQSGRVNNGGEDGEGSGNARPATAGDI